jgi:hypothetical protein
VKAILGGTILCIGSSSLVVKIKEPSGPALGAVAVRALDTPPAGARTVAYDNAMAAPNAVRGKRKVIGHQQIRRPLDHRHGHRTQRFGYGVVASWRVYAPWPRPRT